MDERGRRARVFGSAAGAYAEHRPGYPDAAVGWALGGAAADVVDLAAGTGKLTEALLRRPGTAVTAVEPDPAMLDELRARFPAARAVEGSAEAVPLPDGCADAVVVGSAWHWFDPPRAVAEIARVLRPGVPTTVDGLLATLATHSWALLSEPADRAAAFARVRGYLATRPETGAGAFTLPLVCSVLRTVRR